MKLRRLAVEKFYRLWYNNLMILFFDTETTGLFPGRIIQLSYIMTDGENTVAKNFFFGVSYIEPSAQAVHGFSVEKLAVLSNGHTFSTDIEEIYDDFLSADLIVAHNVKFDIGFLIAEFNYQDRIFRYNESFCTMKRFTPICKLLRSKGEGYKYPKLNELCAFLGIREDDINTASSELFGGATGYHDARFDTVAVYLAVNKAINRGADIWGLEKYL